MKQKKLWNIIRNRASGSKSKLVKNLFIMSCFMLLAIAITSATTIRDDSSLISGILRTSNINVSYNSTSNSDALRIYDYGLGAALKSESFGTGNNSNAAVFRSYGGATALHVQKLTSQEPTAQQAVLKIVKNPSAGVNDTGVLLLLVNNYTGPLQDQANIQLESYNPNTAFLRLADYSTGAENLKYKIMGDGTTFINVTTEVDAFSLFSNSSTKSIFNLNGVKYGITMTNVPSGGYGISMTSGTSGASSNGLLSASLTSASVNTPTVIFGNSGVGDALRISAGRINISSSTGRLYTPYVNFVSGIEVTCNSTNEGLIYYNLTQHKHLGCNSTSWNALY